MSRKKQTEVNVLREERRLLAESSTKEMARLLLPNYFFGAIHNRIFDWWDRQDAGDHQMVLIPREHLKTTMIGLRVVRAIIKDPTIRILYISSTSNLATKQLKFIKDLLTCPTARLYWPELVEREEAKREKWTEREISVDHPLRKEAFIREPTVFTAGLTTNIVGLHADITVLDDVVVHTNAYTELGREKVKEQYGYLSSVETTGAKEWVVGTRYHPKDLYQDLLEMEVQEFDELGNVSNTVPLFECIQEQVESVGDGTGEYLWPRTLGPKGKWYGFNEDVLSKKRAQYQNKIHFRAQYYNDPNDDASAPIKRDLFQYYDQQWISRREGGKWYFKGNRINVFAAVDFAYSTGQKSDYTSIVVVGIDGQGNIYILDIDRFKTTKISDYYLHIFKLHEKWGFRKIRAEVSVAQKVIVDDLKDNYIKPNGLALSVDEYRPSRWQGAKEERILATLEPKYANKQIWHYQGGNCSLLEEELIFANPVHDDIKDALASVVDFATPPPSIFGFMSKIPQQINFHSRWGGVA